MTSCRPKSCRCSRPRTLKCTTSSISCPTRYVHRPPSAVPMTVVVVIPLAVVLFFSGEKHRVQGRADRGAPRVVHRKNSGTRPGPREDRLDRGEYDREHCGRQHRNKIGHSNQRRSQGVHIVFYIGAVVYLALFGLVQRLMVITRLFSCHGR